MIAIHCEPQIEWQRGCADKFKRGLKALGLESFITNSRFREADVAILLGTTCWRTIEADGDYLLVDRASFGDPEYVQLVWNGHGRRGNHCVPEGHGQRIEMDVLPWGGSGSRVLLCGQTETYSPEYTNLNDWYKRITATHFRRHPRGSNPTDLPLMTGFTDVGRVITLNSSVGVEAVMMGIPTVTMDEGAMAWDVTSHSPDISVTPDRRPWLQWLSWTQWTHDEIAEGKPIAHLFEDTL